MCSFDILMFILFNKPHIDAMFVPRKERKVLEWKQTFTKVAMVFCDTCALSKNLRNTDRMLHWYQKPVKIVIFLGESTILRSFRVSNISVCCKLCKLSMKCRTDIQMASGLMATFK